MPQTSKSHPESLVCTVCSVPLMDVSDCGTAAKLTCAGTGLSELSRRLFLLSKVKVEQAGEMLSTVDSKTRYREY